MGSMSDHTSVRSLSVMFMLSLWPFVVTPPWDSYSTVWQSKGWETSVKVEHCHVNGWTTANLQSERTASHVPLKEDLNNVSHRMRLWVFKWRRIKGTYTKSATNPFPTSISLSTFQYHWFTTPHPHVQCWLASKQTCVCDVYCFWLEVLPLSIQFHHEKYCWIHQSWWRTDLFVTTEKAQGGKNTVEL